MEITITESFIPFLQNKDRNGINPNPDYSVEFQEILKIPDMKEIPLMKNQDFCAFVDEAGNPIRVYHNHSENDKPYAVTKFQPDKKKIKVEYLAEGKAFIQESGNNFLHIGWEQILINEKRLLLHASCIETRFGGILFSGPSGVGKSTQADLWCKYENAKLLNGDRTILSKKNSEWLAYGSPYAGSSKVYVNDSCKVRVIVMLEKDLQCSIRRLQGMEAFRKIYAGLTINSWDKHFVDQACDIALNIISEIPVYELKCTADKSAMDILKKELGE